MKLKAWMKKNNITSRQLAAVVEVSESTIYFWTTEIPKYRVIPSSKNLAKLKDYTNKEVMPDDFFID
jgi:DNA-binding XRE family transcriptional regulator